MTEAVQIFLTGLIVGGVVFALLGLALLLYVGRKP